MFNNISKMASSIIAANLLHITTQHHQSREEHTTHPWHLILGLIAFSSVLNLSRVNHGKFSWSLILFHAWTGVIYPSKSSLSAISNSFWKTSAGTCHRESLSRVGGASCSSMPCIDTAWPEGCALEMCDRHGRSSLQVREHNQEYWRRIWILTTEQSQLLFGTILARKAHPGHCLFHLRDFPSCCFSSCSCHYCSLFELL